MTDWHASACVRMSECVSAHACVSVARGHPQHTNVINKVKLLLGRKHKQYMHMHLYTQKPTCMRTNTKKFYISFIHGAKNDCCWPAASLSINKSRTQKKSKKSHQMLYTFHHIFSLPRGWLCYSPVTYLGKTGKHRSNAHHRTHKWAENLLLTEIYKCFFVVSWSTFSGICSHFNTHSVANFPRLWRLTENFACCSLQKSQNTHPPALNTKTHTLCPPLTFKPTFSTTDSYTNLKRPYNNFLVLVHSLILFVIALILINCVLNNYSVKQRHHIKL